MNTAVGIIPARLGSTRFPRKVLADATGKPLIRHVFEAASRCRALSRLIVATDSTEVQQACAAFGATAILTSPDHLNGTSRLSEAAAILRLTDDQLVVNVQGDEPELEPEPIEALVELMTRSTADVGTMACPWAASDDPSDPNIVKVVLRQDGEALYFSRARIPFPRDGRPSLHLRHLGLYAYRARFLRIYPSLLPTPLETAESLEQLRVLEHGYRIAVGITSRPARTGIDTPEQYQAFVRRQHVAPNP